MDQWTSGFFDYTCRISFACRFGVHSSANDLVLTAVLNFASPFQTFNRPRETVAHPILQDADAIMLSAETTTGDYPERSAAMMSLIARR